MTPCERYLDEMKALVDGELPWFRKWMIEFHLRHCSRCSQERSAISRLTSGLRSLDDFQLPPNLAKRLQEVAQSTPVPYAKPNRAFIIAPVLATAALALIAYIASNRPTKGPVGGVQIARAEFEGSNTLSDVPAVKSIDTGRKEPNSASTKSDSRTSVVTPRNERGISTPAFASGPPKDLSTAKPAGGAMNSTNYPLIALRQDLPQNLAGKTPVLNLKTDTQKSLDAYQPSNQPSNRLELVVTVNNLNEGRNTVEKVITELGGVVADHLDTIEGSVKSTTLAFHMSESNMQTAVARISSLEEKNAATGPSGPSGYSTTRLGGPGRAIAGGGVGGGGFGGGAGGGQNTSVLKANAGANSILRMQTLNEAQNFGQGQTMGLNRIPTPSPAPPGQGNGDQAVRFQNQNNARRQGQSGSPIDGSQLDKEGVQRGARSSGQSLPTKALPMSSANINLQDRVVAKRMYDPSQVNANQFGYREQLNDSFNVRQAPEATGILILHLQEETNAKGDRVKKP